MAVQAWLRNPHWEEGAVAAICICTKKPKTKYGNPVYVLCFPDTPVDEEGNVFDPVEWATEEEARAEMEFSGYHPDLIQYRTV